MSARHANWWQLEADGLLQAPVDRYFHFVYRLCRSLQPCIVLGGYTNSLISADDREDLFGTSDVDVLQEICMTNGRRLFPLTLKGPNRSLQSLYDNLRLDSRTKPTHQYNWLHHDSLLTAHTRAN